MSVIQKSEAIVLSAIKYSDSSKIAQLYTRQHGRISVIIKGGRTKQSVAGRVVDPLNHIEAIIYYRESREIQTLSGADLLYYFGGIKEDYERLKYALAVLELIQYLTTEHEQNTRMFDGLARILQRLENNIEAPALSFLRFYLFLLAELGFEISDVSCSQCGSELNRFPIGFSYQKGLVCGRCIPGMITGVEIQAELFSFFVCLKTGKPITNGQTMTGEWLRFLDRFAEFHLTQYRKLNALRL